MIFQSVWQFFSILLWPFISADIDLGGIALFNINVPVSIASVPQKIKTETLIREKYRFKIGWNAEMIDKKSLTLNCDFENNSAKPVSIDHCNFGPNHQIILKDVNGVEPKMTARGVLMKEAFQNGQNRDRNVPVVVKPGHSDRETITLDRYYELKPGKYRVKIRFREWASIPGVTPINETFVIDIVSNELEFVINP